MTAPLLMKKAWPLPLIVEWPTAIVAPPSELSPKPLLLMVVSRTITNTSFRKNANDAPVFQSFDRSPNRFSIGTIPVGRKGIHGAQK